MLSFVKLFKKYLIVLNAYHNLRFVHYLLCNVLVAKHMIRWYISEAQVMAHGSRIAGVPARAPSHP